MLLISKTIIITKFIDLFLKHLGKFYSQFLIRETIILRKLFTTINKQAYFSIYKRNERHKTIYDSDR